MSLLRQIIVRCAVGLALSAAFCALHGCIAIYRKQPVVVRVIDAERGNGIAGATIDVRPDNITHYNAPPPYSARTDATGVARFNALTIDSGWGIDAAGYMGCGTSRRSSGKFCRPVIQLDPAQGPSAYVVYLYRFPEPVLTIVIPNGYTGPLKVRRTLVDRPIQDVPGQRQFQFAMSKNGEVSIDVTQLLYRVYPWDIRVVRQNGTPVPRYDSPHRPSDILVRDVAMHEADGVQRDIFVIGTAIDQYKVAREVGYPTGGIHELDRFFPQKAK